MAEEEGMLLSGSEWRRMEERRSRKVQNKKEGLTEAKGVNVGELPMFMNTSGRASRSTCPLMFESELGG